MFLIYSYNLMKKVITPFTNVKKKKKKILEEFKSYQVAVAEPKFKTKSDLCQRPSSFVVHDPLCLTKMWFKFNLLDRDSMRIQRDHICKP